MNKLALSGLLLLSTSAFAADFTPALEAYLASDIAVWSGDPVLVAAIIAQNVATAAYDQTTIDALDGQWQAEVGTTGSELIAGVLDNPAADFLRAQIKASGGRITEAFITDAKGLNVASTATTSDYWQGDEDKFTKVFPTPDGYFISDVELDDSTQRYQAQISVTIVDPATGQAIGMLTVGIDADSLM